MLSMIFPLVLLVVFFAVAASLWPEGLWSNAINLVNLVTSALLATNFYEPLAAWLSEQSAWFVFFGDYLSIWGIFSLSILILSTATNGVSKHRVRFVKQVENPGGWFLAILNAWVMLCFITMTLHLAPLSRGFFFGGFKAEEKMLFGMAPDRQWLGFMQNASRGAFSRLVGEEDDEEKYVFDPQALFLIKYASRRDEYANTETFFGNSR